MKKIALCFSGGIRHIHSSLPSIIRYFINPMKQNNNQVDIFLYLTYIDKLDPNIDVNFKMIESIYDKDKLLAILKPKKYVIIEYNSELQKKEMTINGENFIEKNWKDQRHKDYGFSAFGMYAKIYKCNLLRKEYEKEHCFEYDFIWRTRLDYIFLDEINLDIIHLSNNNKVRSDCLYLIKDRFAHNTKKETNDKFIGGSGKVMDLISDIYNQMPQYFKEFSKRKKLLEGQEIIQRTISELKKQNKIKKCFMIGHHNTYYKCQGRHKIKQSCKRIFINLADTKLFFELCYLLLYEGYQVYTYEKHELLETFENYYIFKRDELDEFEFIVVDNKDEIKYICKKKIFILYDNDKHFNEILDYVSYKYSKNKKLNFTYNINLKHKHFKKSVFIFYFKSLNISRLLFSLIYFQPKHIIYRIDTMDCNPGIGDTVFYYKPDRGRYKAEIYGIKNDENGNTIYKAGSSWYLRRDIRITDWDKHITYRFLYQSLQIT